MSWMEWWGESLDPGDVGEVQYGERPRRVRSRGIALLACFLALALLGGEAWLLWNLFGLRGGQEWAIAGVATLVYLALGYFVHPAPDYENIGWFGGLFDHPWRYSDDINRWMIFLLVALYPGKFVSEALIDFWRATGYAMPGSGKIIRVRREDT